MLRLRSMYAEQEDDCLLFKQKEQSQGGGLELVETALAVQHMDKVGNLQHLSGRFLSAVYVVVTSRCHETVVVRTWNTRNTKQSSPYDLDSPFGGWW